MKSQAIILVLVISIALVAALLVNNSIASQTEKSQRYQEGYQQGLADGAGHTYNLRDPTYQEVLDFITADKTDENNYKDDSFSCYDYTNLFCNNAFKAGYLCGNVLISFPNDQAHSIACFNTTDNGIIFVEPQSDQIVNLEIGRQYWDRAIYDTPDYSDIVTDYSIIW
jgi:hypothetical protein